MESAAEKLPKWLDMAFFKKILSSYWNDDSIEALSFEMKSGFSEHFGSSLFRCKIDFKSLKNAELLENSIDVVVKAQPMNDGVEDNVGGQIPLFKTEIKMYNEVIPAINQLFNKNGLNVTLGPE